MTSDASRWSARPVLARLVRALVFAVPVAAAVVASWLLHLLLGRAHGWLGTTSQLALLLVVSSIVLFAVDRVARTALPLAALLELSLLFPDTQRPSRMRIARDAIRRRPIEEQLARVREAGHDPAVAATEVLTLVAALHAHDRPTRGHAERVRLLTDLIAEQMGISARDRDLLRWAAILHDIGKLRVPATLLNKAGKPTEQEWAVLRRHPEYGAEIAAGMLPWLGEWGEVIIAHHERYDGSGYPSGLAGEQISLGARIVSVADAYDVMTAVRAYRRPVSRAAAQRELVAFSGRQFDPEVVRAMLANSAPRLRRAQGLIALLSDIPMVANSNVPVATLARVVGYGAIAGSATVAPLATFASPAVVAAAQTSTAHHNNAAPSRPRVDAALIRITATAPPATTPKAPAKPTTPHRKRTTHPKKGLSAKKKVGNHHAHPRHPQRPEHPTGPETVKHSGHSGHSGQSGHSGHGDTEHRKHHAPEEHRGHHDAKRDGTTHRHHDAPPSPPAPAPPPPPPPAPAPPQPPAPPTDDHRHHRHGNIVIEVIRIIVGQVHRHHHDDDTTG